jgi:four helix bundle protein
MEDGGSPDSRSAAIREASMDNYKQLIVWQRSMDLAADIYRWTSSLPKHELYGLSSQLQRSAVSIPANIAEGHGRSTTKEYLRFLSIARGSLAELETELLLAKRIGYGDSNAAEKLFKQIEEISRLLRGLQKALREKLNQQEKRQR